MARARRILEVEGFEALNMRRLARELNVNAGGIYFYFPDKDALVRHVCDALYADYAKSQRPLRTIRDPVERLKKICTRYIEISKRRPSLFRLLFVEPAAERIQPESRLRQGDPDSDPYAFFLEAVRDVLDLHGCAEPAAVQRFGQMVWSLGHGAACLNLAFGADDWFRIGDPKRIFVEGLDLMLAGLRKGKKP